MRPIQEHPDYHEGFWSAQEGHTLAMDESDTFIAGWCAYHDCLRFLEGASANTRELYEAWRKDASPTERP